MPHLISQNGLEILSFRGTFCSVILPISSNALCRWRHRWSRSSLASKTVPGVKIARHEPAAKKDRHFYYWHRPGERSGGSAAQVSRGIPQPPEFRKIGATRSCSPPRRSGYSSSSPPRSISGRGFEASTQTSPSIPCDPSVWFSGAARLSRKTKSEIENEPLPKINAEAKLEIVVI